MREREWEIAIVRSILHFTFGFLSAAVETLFKSAYELAEEYTSSVAAQSLARLADEEADMDEPVYEAAYNAARLELKRVVRSEKAQMILIAADRKNGEEEPAMLTKYIEQLAMGLFIYIKQYAPKTQYWCVE